MLTYEQFKTEVEKNLAGYLYEEYRDIPLKIVVVEKTNRTLDGIRFDDPSKTGSITPVIYIDHMYTDYMNNKSLESVMEYYGELMSRSLKEAPDVVRIPDLNEIKDNIVFRLINTEQNRRMLENMPHRQYFDLSIVYYYVKPGDTVSQNAKIDNYIADRLGLTEEQLFKLAVENTKRILIPTSKPLLDIISDEMKKNGMSEEFADIMVSDVPPLYVISNVYNMNGAASILYEDILHETAEKIGDDIYIMPSSTHEVIAIAASAGDPYMLAEMVREINMAQVILEERLSNEVYHYDRNLRKVTLATDVPDKRLDEQTEFREMQHQEPKHEERRTSRG